MPWKYLPIKALTERAKYVIINMSWAWEKESPLRKSNSCLPEHLYFYSYFKENLPPKNTTYTNKYIFLLLIILTALPASPSSPLSPRGPGGPWKWTAVQVTQLIDMGYATYKHIQDWTKDFRQASRVTQLNMLYSQLFLRRTPSRPVQTIRLREVSVMRELTVILSIRFEFFWLTVSLFWVQYAVRSFVVVVEGDFTRVVNKPWCKVKLFRSCEQNRCWNGTFICRG